MSGSSRFFDASGKEVRTMCDHERLRTVGDRVFCCACGAELDIAFLKGKNKANNPAQDEQTDKTPAKKRPGRKAAKTA